MQEFSAGVHPPPSSSPWSPAVLCGWFALWAAGVRLRLSSEVCAKLVLICYFSHTIDFIIRSKKSNWKVEFCGFGFPVMKPVKPALHVGMRLLRGFSFPCWNVLIKQCKTSCDRLHACFWHVCSGSSHACGPLEIQKKQGQCFLRTDVSCSFWSQLVEKLMMKGCKGKRWIPEYWIAYLVLQLNLYLLFSPAKLYSQFEYDTVNVMYRCRTRQVLCLCALHPGLLPWTALAEWWGTTGAGKWIGVSCLVTGTCLSLCLLTEDTKGFGHSVSEGWLKETGLSLLMNF